MESFIYKHGYSEMFDKIENAVDEPYKRAAFRFDNNPKIDMDKKVKLANALWAILVSYKITKERLEVQRNSLKSRNKLLNTHWKYVGIHWGMKKPHMCLPWIQLIIYILRKKMKMTKTALMAGQISFRAEIPRFLG